FSDLLASTTRSTWGKYVLSLVTSHLEPCICLSLKNTVRNAQVNSSQSCSQRVVGRRSERPTELQRCLGAPRAAAAGPGQPPHVAFLAFRPSPFPSPASRPSL